MTTAPEVREQLQRRYCSLLKRLAGIETDRSMMYFRVLTDMYGEPHRKYHTLNHISDCLTTFDHFKRLAKKPEALEIAIFYHDIFYNTTVTDRENVERSAAELVTKMYTWRCDADDTIDAFSAVLATTHDHMPAKSDNKLMVDIDLSGLGAPWDVFLRNNQNVRAEYSQYTDKEFRVGNSVVLHRFLDRTPLYFHPEIEAAFGKQAKANLERWLNRD